MNRTILYIIMALLVIIIAIMLIPKNKVEVVNPEALPVNGLVTTPPQPIAAVPVAPTMTTVIAPTLTPSQAVVIPVPATAPNAFPSSSDNDDVPTGAEISGESPAVAPAANMPQPQYPESTTPTSNGMPLPPSEGQ